MEITQDTKDNLKAAVVLCLDTYAGDKDIDEQMVASVIEVIREIPNPEPADPQKVAVKYIGKREQYSDGLFDTGIWAKDQEKLVPIVTASKMLAHKSVYVPGEIEKVTDVVDEIAPEKKDEKEEDLHNVRNSIYAMTKPAAVRKFIAENFNGLEIDLPKNAKITLVQEKAIQLIDQYRLPGL